MAAPDLGKDFEKQKGWSLSQDEMAYLEHLSCSRFEAQDPIVTAGKYLAPHDNS